MKRSNDAVAATLPRKKEEMRTCAYCGKPKSDRCGCRFRTRRKRFDGLNGGISVTCEGTSAESTLAEFINSIKEALPVSSADPEKVIGTFRWSFDLAEPITKG